jgi:hypothetical protein
VETAAAFNELMDVVRDGEKLFTEGDRAVTDPVSALEGYPWLTTVLAVALDCFVWADPLRPALVELTGPTKRWGGDNSDARYWYAALDPAHRYRVSGVKGGAVYMSLTVYGGPDDGRWSSRIVTTVNDRTIPMADDGTFSVELGPFDADANALVIRDYLAHPGRDQPTALSIECLDGPSPADPPRPTDAEMAQRYRRAANFLRDLLAVFPIPAGEPNVVQPPYPVPEQTYGWAAGDASYAMGAFALADDEALVIEGTSPPCVFWNLCLWNPFLQTFDYRYEQTTINGAQCTYEPDGSWRIVVASRDPGVPNWLSTAGHRSGVLWFRWFLPEADPDQPTTKVVQLA